MARLQTRRRRRTSATDSLMILGPVIMLLALFPLGIAIAAVQGLGGATTADPLALAAAIVGVGALGAGGLAYGAYGTFIGFAGEARR